MARCISQVSWLLPLAPLQHISLSLQCIRCRLIERLQFIDVNLPNTACAFQSSSFSAKLSLYICMPYALFGFLFFIQFLVLWCYGRSGMTIDAHTRRKLADTLQQTITFLFVLLMPIVCPLQAARNACCAVALLLPFVSYTPACIADRSRAWCSRRSAAWTVACW